MTGTIVVGGGGELPPPDPGDLPPDPGDLPPDPGDPLPDPGDPPPRGGGDVRIFDNGYAPRTHDIAVGETVRWANTGNLPHTVTRVGGGFDSGFLSSGDTFSRTFTAAGSFDYFCTIHPEMTGTIVVGGGGSPPPPTPDAGDPATEPEAPAPLPAGSAAVDIIDNAYDPGVLTVTTGQTVAWANLGDLPHTVSAADGSFDSGFLLTGDGFRSTFASAGTYEYFCTIHPEMTGMIIVSGETVEVPEPTGGSETIVSEPDGEEEEEAAAAAEAGAAPRSIRRVGVVDNGYDPADITIEQGQAVRWSNTGVVPHTITARAGSFDSGFLNPGDQFLQVFDTPGTFDYFCTLHPEMVGTVTVVEAAPASVAAIAPLTIAGQSAGIPFPVAVMLGASIVLGMTAFAVGMARFGAAADAQR